MCSSLRSWQCYPDWNSKRLRRAATRCTVTTHDSIQLPWEFLVGYRMSRLACFTGRSVIVWLVMVSSYQWKRAGRNSSWRDFSAGSKSSPISLVVRCTKSHFYCRDLQDRVSGLRVLAFHPHHICDYVYPVLHFRPHKNCLCTHISGVPSKLTSSCHDVQYPPPE